MAGCWPTENKCHNLARWRVGLPYSAGSPTVTITNPISSTVYTNNPDPLTITATALSSTNLLRVEFYAAGDLIGSDPHDYDTPYSYDWPSPPAGVHLLKAVAIDTNNL